MNLTLPVLLQHVRTPGAPAVYVARPLFAATPVVRGERTDRLLAKLAHDLETQLAALGRMACHDDLAAAVWNPPLRTERADIAVELRRRTARGRFLFVVLRQFGRRVAFTPGLPELWFDLSRGEDLRVRAAEVLTRHFRAAERDADEGDDVRPEQYALTGSAEVVPIDVAVRPPAVPPEAKVPKFLLLGGEGGPLDGADELRAVGRCLDRLYPDDLDRAALREAEVAELSRLLAEPDRRPVLLVGPRQVGKTTLVHEHVYRAVAGRSVKRADRENVWLIAPQRLISGMSYVGQWENRLLAILKHMRKRGHVFYCDDLLGLYRAGQSACSSLSVADVLKPYLDRRDVRFLGEITPEALRVLRERDRPFADLFHVLPVVEPADADVLRILIDVRRRLEASERCEFELDALPAALDLQRRYARSLAFPGKAAGFLRQLAVKHKRGSIRRADVLAEFHAQSGIAVNFLDGRSTLKRREVIDVLTKGVLGQPAALDAAADAIAVAKARLNDPGRPLASFLFLGPTGVGKTQCAKALAAYLFGDAERLVRFDLNEYAAPGAASRLVGTFGQPEGLLTSAIRRRPFAVVLFDEVEKADPEVFDLLLQVLGEGRLTDALGRTADFTNALIVMTSNLGVREAEGNLGFRRDDAATDAVFVQAAEKFFRPEFFNRIDRVIPFRRLSRDHVRGIADGLIRDVFAREGLVQRRCLLTVEPTALERLVDAGFDPDLGARALKRVVERQLAAPVARELAGRVPGGFTAIYVLPGPGRLDVGVRTLQPVPASPRPPLVIDDPAEWLASVRTERQRLEGQFASLKSDAPVTARLDAGQERYYRLRTQAERMRELERELGDTLRDRKTATPSLRKPDAARTPGVVRIGFDASKMILREMAAARDINEYLDEIAVPAAGAAGPLDARLAALADQLTLLRRMVESALAGAPDSVLLWLRARPGEFAATAAWMAEFYEASLPPWAVELEWDDALVRANASSGFYRVHGPHAATLVAGEAGTHLFCPRGEPVLPLAVEVLPSAEALRARLDARAAWLAALAAGTATAADDPLAFGPVVRVYETGPAARAGEYGRVVDFRSGLIGDGVNGVEFFR